MAVSTFDLFKIGIGLSSSHTVGPMRAACLFASRLGETPAARPGGTGALRAVWLRWARPAVGHGTDKAVMLGLEGEQPDLVDPDLIEARPPPSAMAGR